MSKTEGLRALAQKLHAENGATPAPVVKVEVPAEPKLAFSPARRRAMAEGQKRRWAKLRGETPPAKPVKRAKRAAKPRRAAAPPKPGRRGRGRQAALEASPAAAGDVQLELDVISHILATWKRLSPAGQSYIRARLGA